MPNVTQGLREQLRVTRPGGTVSAIACFCHSGGLTHYNGRYPLPGNHRIDMLDRKLDLIFRQVIRPQSLGYDPNLLNLNILWQFKEVGLQNIQINGNLPLTSPGDERIPIEEGAAYAIARLKSNLKKIREFQATQADDFADNGFTPQEFDELIAMKVARLTYLQGDPARVREVMEVFAEPLMIIRGTKAA